MKKQQFPISDLLGLTQNELAMLLKVSRSLVALYETGERELPLHAKHLLESLVRHMNSDTVKAKSRSDTAEQEKSAKTHISRLLAENEWKIMVSDNKIAALEKKVEKEKHRRHLVDHLQSLAVSKDSTPISFLKGSAFRASPSKLDSHTQLLDLKIKHELLEYENKLLKSKIK